MTPSELSKLGEIPIRCTMVSVMVLRGIGDTTRMLLVRRASKYLNGEWSYIAGHVVAGESGVDAALRELREETSLVPDTLYATSFCERFYAPATACVEVVPAFVARVADDAKVRLNVEHSTCRWATLDDASEQLPFGSQRELIAHVLREFVQRKPSPFLRVFSSQAAV